MPSTWTPSQEVIKKFGFFCFMPRIKKENTLFTRKLSRILNGCQNFFLFLISLPFNITCQIWQAIWSLTFCFFEIVVWIISCIRIYNIITIMSLKKIYNYGSRKKMKSLTVKNLLDLPRYLLGLFRNDSSRLGHLDLWM